MMNRFVTLILLIFQLLSVFANAQNTNEHPLPEINRSTVQGGELEYEIYGEGEPVLLIHGSVVAATFSPFMGDSAFSDFQLIRYHRQGFSGSTAAQGPINTYIERAAADAKRLLQNLGIDRAHIVGHSYGGLISLQLAHDTPELVHSLVLLEPPMQFTSMVDQEIAPPPGMELYNRGKPAEAVDEFMSVVVSPEWRSIFSSTIPGAIEQAETDAHTNFKFEFPAMENWKFNMEMAKEVSQPILYIRGSEGLPFPDFTRTIWPEMKYNEVKGLTHALHVQDPRTIADRIIQFLAQYPI